MIVPVVFAAGIILLFVGLWRGYFIARHRGARFFWSNVILFVSGWLVIAFANFIGPIAENVAASLGSFGVSAKCYGRTEDVLIAPIPLQQWRHLISLQKNIRDTNHFYTGM